MIPVSAEVIIAVGSVLGAVLSWAAARGAQRNDAAKQHTERYEGMVESLNASYRTLADDLERNRELVNQQRQDAARLREEVAAQAREIMKLGSEVRRHARELTSLRGKYELSLDYLENVMQEVWDTHRITLPEPPGQIKNDLTDRRNQ